MQEHAAGGKFGCRLLKRFRRCLGQRTSRADPLLIEPYNRRNTAVCACMVPKTSPGDARVLILAWTDGLDRATAEYVGLTALFPFKDDRISTDSATTESGTTESAGRFRGA